MFAAFLQQNSSIPIPLWFKIAPKHLNTFWLRSSTFKQILNHFKVFECVRMCSSSFCFYSKAFKSLFRKFFYFRHFLGVHWVLLIHRLRRLSSDKFAKLIQNFLIQLKLKTTRIYIKKKSTWRKRIKLFVYLYKNLTNILLLMYFYWIKKLFSN